MSLSSQVTFESGSWVWITDEVERYLPAKVMAPFSPGQPVTVRTEDGEDRALSVAQSAEVQDCNPEALDSGISDLVSISDLNEMSILHNLRIRYKEDKIYTNVSSILISVNPFKLLPLYTPEVLDQYRNGSRDRPPHIFAVAYNSYNNMLVEKSDQSVVISGESGAGKSEATKLILQFLTDVSGKVAGVTSATNTLEQQILAANPILEAFGNAKTLRNNNSSRFGKLITVKFDNSGSIMGGGIINYLLEKSRVVGQTKGERNYHIFYQLLSMVDANPQLAEALKLQDPELFNFTNQSGVIHIEGVSDEKDFEEFQNSMNILRFSPEEQSNILRIVAGVLHFGNLQFKEEKVANAEDGSAITNPEVADYAAELWGADPAQMKQFLTHKNLGAREAIMVKYNVQQAQDARDAMVKRVYADLFQFVVDKINAVLSASGRPHNNFIGVLDIFGFESFAVNSFEQLCINFCNEKLQFHFNEHIFRMEQTLYAAEGIVISGTSFVDNQPTLDLLEAKATGLFSMCDEEISVPKGSDDGLLQKIFKQHQGKHANLVKPKPNQCIEAHKCFGILHYAGPVYYTVTNFLEKNKDQLHGDIQSVLRESSMSMVNSMFPPDVVDAAAKGGRRMSVGGKSAMKTLGGQFKQQLQDLIATLNSTYPHFVRCMKPNDDKVGNLFHSQRMQDQLRYAGLVEVCRIRKLGYPVRRDFIAFYKRYRCCDPSASNLDELTASLSAKGLLKAGEWAKGHTKIFLRTAQNQELELAREAAFLVVVISVQKVARRFVYKKRYQNFIKLLANVREAIQVRELANLTQSIEMSFELPWGGQHLPLIQQAKALQLRLKEEARVTSLLTNAIQAVEMNALENAVSAALGMNPPFDSPLVLEAQSIISRLKAELEIRIGLTAAMDSRDRQGLVDYLAKAAAMGYECNETKQAVVLQARLLEEDRAIERLTAAMAAAKSERAELDALRDKLSECADLGLSVPKVQEAKQLYDKLENELQARIAAENAAAAAAAAAEEARKSAEMEERRKLRVETEEKMKAALLGAIASKDLIALNRSIQEAMQLGLQTPEMDKAHSVRTQLQVLEEAKSKISAAIDILSVKSQSGISAGDIAKLDAAIEFTQKLDVPAEWLSDILANAKAEQEKHRNSLDIERTLSTALKSGDRIALRNALNSAENMDLQGETVDQAKKAFKEAEIAHRAAKAQEDAKPTEDYDEAEKARALRHEIARQARFDIKNYPGLRTPEDFAKGIILSKSKVKDGFLLWQGTVIPRSLVDMSKESNKVAIQIFKDLLGYMGDKQMPFPAMLAQDILRKGFEYKGLRDEIFMQIIKQITSNPRTESQAKGWQMLCMCLITFPPSVDFENFLLHFILEKYEKGRGAVHDYAKYCLRTLEGILNSGEASGFVPSVDEIQAYKERPPILATIELVDGNVIAEDLPITPDFNVGKVLEICTSWLDLTDPRANMMGVFVYDLGETDEKRAQDDPYANAVYASLPRTPRPLRNEDFMGDVIVQKSRQKRKFKFVMKKKIYLPQHNWRGDDPHYERLIYLQAEDEAIIKGNIVIDDEDKATELSSLSFAVAFGEDFPETVEEIVGSNAIDFICPAWRTKRSPEQWAAAILKARSRLASRTPGDLQEDFVRILAENPLYGTHWFFVYKVNNSPAIVANLPRDLLLGFNADGMHAFTADRKFLASFPYADIYRWGGSASQFSLIIWDAAVGESFELIVTTAQASDMAAAILDHIRAIMSIEDSSA